MSDFDMNKAASTMFPDMAPTAAPAPAPAAKPVSDLDKAAARLFPDMVKPTATTPAKPVAKLEEPVDETTKAEKFFENSPIYDSALRAVENAAIENLSTPEDAATIAAAYEPWMREFDLNSTEAGQLSELGVSATMSPPSEATVAGWAGSARDGLRQDFGNRAGEALQAAQQLIAKNPQLKAFLEETQLGSHPNFVRIAAQKAMDLKKRGKL